MAVIDVVWLGHREEHTNILDFLPTAFSIGKNVINFMKRKNGRHFKRQAAIGWRNMQHHD